MNKNLQKVNVLGVSINAITIKGTLSKIQQWIETGERHYVSVCTVHTVMECQMNPSMRRAVNGAGMATPDGMPLVWLAKMRNQEPVERVYGPDLMLALCKLSDKLGYRHYFYGGTAGVPEQLAANLKNRFPDLAVAGTYSPPFRPLSDEEDKVVIENINNSKADIVWVGLGTPKQDLWMASHRQSLDAAVLIGVGAAFDFHTGKVRQAPRWMQNSGLEWLFRLFMEPRRLWKRYLLYNPWFLWLVFLQQTGLKKFPVDS